jgi:hypothetical protein
MRIWPTLRFAFFSSVRFIATATIADRPTNWKNGALIRLKFAGRGKGEG